MSDAPDDLRIPHSPGSPAPAGRNDPPELDEGDDELLDSIWDDLDDEDGGAGDESGEHPAG